MEKVRFGIVGVGNMGSGHAKSFLGGKVEHGILTAICDLKKERMEKVRAMDGGAELATYTDYRDLFASGKVDAVIVAVPHYFHPRISMDALAAGLHVICEKPEGVYTKQVKELNEAAGRSDRLFTVMFNQRTNCVYRKMREMIRNGELGEIKRVNWIITTWYRSQSYYDSGDWRATWRGEGGGVLLNQAPHQLDLWQWICGMPTALSAVCDTGKYHRIEVEDDATILARFANGATGVFVTTTGDCPGTNRLEIDGERGKLVLEHGELHLWQTAAPCAELIADAPGMSPDGSCTHTVYRPDAPASAHRGILQNFTDAVLHGTPLLAPGADGQNELMLSNAAYLSAWQGGAWVDLPPDCALFDRLLAQRAASSAEHGGTPAGTAPADGYSSRWSVNW